MTAVLNNDEPAIISSLYQTLLQNQHLFAPVVAFDNLYDRLLKMNFTASNTSLSHEVVSDLYKFGDYINEALKNLKFGIGGYNELRTMYSRSEMFGGEEPRRLHLGTDIWGPADTEIMAPMDGTVHSFAFNNQYGDYGATIILQHQLNGQSFHTLFGHLSLADIENLNEGDPIAAGQVFAHFGSPAENGHWPPHLHFQIIENMYDKMGDYPGVCKASESEQYLTNSPDADLILQLNQCAV